MVRQQPAALARWNPLKEPHQSLIPEQTGSRLRLCEGHWADHGGQGRRLGL